MANSFDNRPRMRLCAVSGCDEETAQHRDLDVGDHMMRRVFLCDDHEKARREGGNLLLVTSRIETLLIGGNEGSGLQRLRGDLEQVVAQARSQSKAATGDLSLRVDALEKAVNDLTAAIQSG